MRIATKPNLIMKNLILLSFCFIFGLSIGQVTGVDYLMKYNCETNQYDVNIVILGGSATSASHRVQFNSQISLVVPTGETVQITEKYMPLIGNQNYNGSIPMDWKLGNPILSPEAQPENDFYNVTPEFATTSFYNNLKKNDVVTVFSFIAGSSEQYDENVRFYKNGMDPNSSAPGMGGGNFNNGFTIGGPTQLYNNNSEEACITSVNKISPLISSVYPNPFHNQFTIDLTDEIINLQIVDVGGTIYYQSGKIPKGMVTINTHDYTRGLYFIRVGYKNGSFKSQRITKL